MNLSQGDRIIIRTDPDSLTDPLFMAIDGLEATISEIYQNTYEPGIDRFEVELDQPVMVEGDRVKIVPGLYIENIESIEESKYMNEGKTLSFKEWFVKS